ncbi:proline-rich protein 19 [Discoglossus pictus]
MMNTSSSCHSCLNLPMSSSAGSEPRTMNVLGDVKNILKNSTNRSLKVKRRKTKKERNNAKFNKSQEERLITQVSNSSFFRRQESRPHHHNCLKVVPPSALRGACNSNKVIITQSRLSHHHGMFNREVKSINIGRLMGQEKEKDIIEGDCQESRSQERNSGPRSTITTPVHAPQTDLKDPVLSAKQKEGDGQIQNTEPVPDIGLDEEKVNNTSCSPPADVELANTLLNSNTDIQSSKCQTAPVLEVAEKIFRMLNSHMLFPGRNLVSEGQKSIMTKVLQQHRTNTTLSTLPMRRKLDYSDGGKVSMKEYYLSFVI